MSHLYEVLARRVDKWRADGYPADGFPAIGEIFEWASDPDTGNLRYLRRPQLRALEKETGAVPPELRTDPKYGKFFQHQPARARVKVTRKRELATIDGCRHRRASSSPRSATGVPWSTVYSSIRITMARHSGSVGRTFPSERRIWWPAAARYPWGETSERWPSS